MTRLIPATRAIVIAAGLVLGTTSLAAAGPPKPAPAPEPVEAAPAPEPVEAPPPEKPFSPTIYAGPSIGWADQEHQSSMAWTVQVLARPIQWLGLQIEYLNLGNDHNPGDKGYYDGVYFGVAPMLPLGNFDLYAQVGLAIGDQGDDVAAGAGAMYTLPIEFLETNNVDLALRLDYKYLNWASGDNMVTFGFMFGFHK